MDRYMIVIPAKNRAFSLKCDGADGETMKLDTMQKLVGGYIETVPTRLEAAWAREKAVNGLVLLVDEEGRLKEKGVNERATEMADGKVTYFGRKPLVGPAVLAASRGEDLIGFARTVAEDLLREWG